MAAVALGIGGCPPVVHVALIVKLTTLVIESVGHLVSHYYTNGTVVAGVIGIYIKEWWLQDGCREVDAVEEGMIKSVNRLRCDP